MDNNIYECGKIQTEIQMNIGQVLDAPRSFQNLFAVKI